MQIFKLKKQYSECPHSAVNKGPCPIREGGRIPTGVLPWSSLPLLFNPGSNTLFGIWSKTPAHLGSACSLFLVRRKELGTISPGTCTKACTFLASDRAGKCSLSTLIWKKSPFIHHMFRLHGRPGRKGTRAKGPESADVLCKAKLAS